MRVKFHKEIEFFIKNLFFSKSYLLKKRIERAIKKNEEAEINLVKKFTNKDEDCIDVGVYRGVYTYEMSKYSKTVHSFEANPIIFKSLKKNLKKLIKNVVFYNLALSDQNKDVKLKIPIRNSKSNKNNPEEYYKLGTATIHEKNKIKNYENFIIKSLKLDDINLKNKISFIKIDVEGHEIPVIKGGIKTILKNKPVLLVEIEEKYSKKKVPTSINFINSIGYKSYVFKNNSLEKTDKLHNLKKFNNFIFIPN